MARIVFMGSSEFACPALDCLADAGHRIAGVYTRGGAGHRRARRTPVARLAGDRGFRVYVPATLRTGDQRQILSRMSPDIVVVAAYGLILPPDLLEIPRHGCLNIHASLLPRWRGAAPVARAIMAGDARTGVCIMRMESGVDTGPVLCHRRTDISDTDTRQSLEARLADSGAGLIVEAVAEVMAGRAVFRSQSDEGVTYADKLHSDQTRIDWNLSSEQVRRHIHGLSPEPGAWCLSPEGERLGVLSCRVVEGVEISAPAGCLLDAGLLVCCGRGAVRLSRVQRAGGRAMEAQAFQNGAHLTAGQHLS